jgi:peptidoglycan/LPS O-acetylase OafA/YrhL
MTSDPVAKKRTAWSRAVEAAEQTPESRNRYVDLLRAVSITAVVAGHWLMAAPFMEAGRLELANMLTIEPWTRWMTWAFQVMPVFFIVGGYSNAASWDAAQRNGLPYGEWLTTRLRRLIGPVLPLVVVWTAIAVVARIGGVTPEMIKLGSQAALVPTWFLAVYVLVVLLVPVTRAAWRRFGVASFWALALTAVAVDLAGFVGGISLLRWTNYLFVWLAVHQLGYLWRDGRLAGPARALPWAALGLVVLVGLVAVGGYPISMVGVPGERISNTLPPTLAMLALGLLQGGLLLAIETHVRRWLRRRTPWAATILVNGTIMTVYLWHMTGAILLIGLAYQLDVGLGLLPGTTAWWLTRPVWMAVLAVGLVILLTLFGRFERLGANAPPLPARVCVAGALMTCTGLALIALEGVAADGPFFGLRAWMLPALLGAVLISLAPRRAST